MLRKASLFCITLLLSNSSFASGLYVGAGVGPEGGIFSQNATVVRAFNFDVKDKEHEAGTGVFGSVFGGYWWSCRQFYLAAELNANASTLEFSQSNKELLHLNFSHTKYKIHQTYGISVTPGYILCDRTLFYARLGYNLGHFQVDTTDVSLQNQNKYLYGYRYGVGIREKICPKLDVFLDYSHISYENAHMFTLDHSSFTIKRTRVFPETAQVQLGFVYYLC